MEKDIIERARQGDDMMIWQLEKEGIKLDEAQIKRQEEELTSLKEQVWDINKKLERIKVPTIIFGNVCSIAGLREIANIRKQVIEDMIAREQPDIVGLIETNIQDGKYEFKGIGRYVQYKTEPNKNKGVMIVVKEEMHPVLKNIDGIIEE